MNVRCEPIEGHTLVQSITYSTPTKFVSCQLVPVAGRKWWQFWLPKTVCVFTWWRKDGEA